MKTKDKKKIKDKTKTNKVKSKDKVKLVHSFIFSMKDGNIQGRIESKKIAIPKIILVDDGEKVEFIIRNIAQYMENPEITCIGEAINEDFERVLFLKTSDVFSIAHTNYFSISEVLKSKLGTELENYKVLNEFFKNNNLLLLEEAKVSWKLQLEPLY